MGQTTFEDKEILGAHRKCCAHPIIDGFDQLFAGRTIQTDARFQEKSLGLPMLDSRHIVSAPGYRRLRIPETTTTG